jgi:hypothetical protein
MNTQANATELLARSRERLRLAMCPAGSAPEQVDWNEQALKLGLKLSKDTAQASLQSAADQHPYALVLGAAALGALVVLARPWRWHVTSELLESCVPDLLAAALKYLPNQPADDPAKR